MILRPSFLGFFFSVAEIVLDEEANAFIVATGITDDTQKSAINKLVLNLKQFGIWTKLVAVYPFVGGTAFSHKFNLKQPVDDDVAFRLSFFGGWTHTSTGAKPNGVDAYANTHLTQNKNLSANAAGLSYYSRENIVAPLYNVEIGAFDGSALYGGVRRNGASDISYINIGANPSSAVYSAPTSAVFITGTRVSSTDLRIYENGLQTAVDTSINTHEGVTIPVFLGALNYIYSGGADYYTNRECAFASIDSGLTAFEAAKFYEAVQIFQTSLGREI